jgi:hypothetical protein
VGVLGGSLLAAIAGIALLKWALCDNAASPLIA